MSSPTRTGSAGQQRPSAGCAGGRAGRAASRRRAARTPSSADQVAEHALERVVGRGRPRGGGCRRPGRSGQTIRVNAPKSDGLHRQHGRRPARRRRRPGRPAAPPRAGRSSEERTVNRCGRSVISRRIERKSPDAARRPAYTTRTASASRSTSSRMCDENRIVRPSAAIRGAGSIMCSRWRGSMPLNGSSSSRIARLVDERRGELDALAHALRSTCRSAGRPRRPARPWRSPGRRPPSGVGDALQLGVEPDELATGQVARDGLALRDEPDHRVDRRGRRRRAPVDADRARRRREQPGQQVEQRRLAGAVRPEQAGHARAERERDVVDRDDVAVPARDVVDLDGRDGRGRRHRAVAAHDAARREPASNRAQVTA